MEPVVMEEADTHLTGVPMWHVSLVLAAVVAAPAVVGVAVAAVAALLPWQQ